MAKSDPKKALDYLNFGVGQLISIKSNSNAVGFTLGLLELFLGDIFRQKNVKDEIKGKLLSVAGVQYSPNGTNSTTWSAQSGMIISEYFNGYSIANPYSRSYSKYQHYRNAPLTGVKWYDGKWSF